MKRGRGCKRILAEGINLVLFVESPSSVLGFRDP